jgi:hypothetical protein
VLWEMFSVARFGYWRPLGAPLTSQPVSADPTASVRVGLTRRERLVMFVCAGVGQNRSRAPLGRVGARGRLARRLQRPHYSAHMGSLCRIR